MTRNEIIELEKTFEIKNKMGMHARPASLLVQACSKFLSEIFFEKEGLQVNGKSILGIMTLAAPYGSKLTVKVKGPDAEAALKSIEEIFENKFNEE
ncbi:HPr family phosphocarrier protein [Candidatus Dependentiae bacterium]|nr:HPr family phosphocarrier protein [Candidatus Dependentiae bacterium]